MLIKKTEADVFNYKYIKYTKFQKMSGSTLGIHNIFYSISYSDLATPYLTTLFFDKII